MFITNKTIISFEIPRECDSMRKFREENDMDSWREIGDSNHITFIHEEYFQISVQGGEVI